MPIGRYMAWVGASLLTLLYVANWFQPQSLAEPAAHEINKPVIRIASMQQPPERIVIDTNLPTIVPPPTLVAEAAPDEPLPQVQSASIAPHATVAGVEKKKSKAKKKQVNQVASKQPAPARTTVVESDSSTTIAPPTRLSFANIISGQLVRDLFNLH
jgi:hypothetical protein